LLTALGAVLDFFLVVGVALAAVLLNTIDGRGFLASVAVGVAIIYGGGLQWFVVVAVFFVLGVAFTLYKYGYKKELGSAQEKGGARNWPNILANGGVASSMAIINVFYPASTVAAFFLGAVSASAADTAATELGLLSREEPRLIVNPSKKVSRGTSGGVSALGLGAAGFASVVMGVIAMYLGVLSVGLSSVVVCLSGGLCGAVADSLLGATVQRQGYCVVCLKPTESLSHCGEAAHRTRGASFIENNIVNLASTVVGGSAALAALLALGPTA
jgi:uncharacterized protein (TIGR00297 family)